MKLNALRLLVLGACFALPSAYAQQLQREVLSIVSIENVTAVDQQTIEFTLTLRRTLDHLGTLGKWDVPVPNRRSCKQSLHAKRNAR